ncbi:MAG: YfhO family protein [Bacteroidetes bacterium]|nr:YfhO family protein [Bacteroidota bacterium]
MATKPTPQTASSTFIPEKYQDLAYIGAIAIAVLIFLAPALFTGGSFGASDNIASNSFTPYLDAAKKSGEFALWNPYIFSGLPSYAALLTTGDRWWDFISKGIFGVSELMSALFHNDAARIAFFYILYGAGMYLLMRSKKHERFTAFFTGFAATFSTWVIVWIIIGHNTKPVALSTFPFILLCLEKLREKFSLKYSVILVLAVHALVESTHVQMAFYGVCVFGLYLLFEAISRLITKNNPGGVFRAGIMLALAGGLAFSMSADRYLSVIEYKPYSTRGTAPIEQTESKKQDASGGFDYDYCTNWSFSPEETITFFVPNFYGFGKMEYKPSGRGKGHVLQTYWGQMAFTDAANYMGIGVLALAILGFFAYRKDVFVQFLLTISIFSLLISFGKNMPILYDVLFYHLPGFNNFRAPQMALVMMQFAVPILAGYGLTALISWRGNLTPQRKKALFGGIGGFVAFFIIGLLYSGIGEEGYVQSVIDSKKGFDQGTAQWLFSQMTSDWLTTAFLGIVMAVLAYLFTTKKLKQGIFYLALTALLVIDLWRVDFRPMEINKGNIAQAEFRQPDFVDFIKKDKSLYRVADFIYLTTGKTNVPAYFLLENIHGYHSAKLRVYQDLLDVAGGQGGGAITNPTLLSMLNVKYMAAAQPLFQGVQPAFEGQMAMNGQSMQTLVYQNPSVLPRAFFVDTVHTAKGIDILNHIKNNDFNPKEVAFVEENLPKSIEPTMPEATANVVEHKNEYIKIEANATGNNLLFVSEVHYPVCWKAYIDGAETPIYKTNYAFRSVMIPKGKHTIEFKYISEKFELGKRMSLGANILTIFAGVVALFFGWRKKDE